MVIFWSIVCAASLYSVHAMDRREKRYRDAGDDRACEKARGSGAFWGGVCSASFCGAAISGAILWVQSW